MKCKERGENILYEGGVWPPFEAFYIESMLWNAISAKRSIEVISVWLEMVEKDDADALVLSKAELFEQLQNILHQAGCISRYFFPARKKEMHVGRAQHLRQALGVGEDSILADRNLRNAIEHFDERLDKYLLENQVGNFIPADVCGMSRESEIPLHIFKGFYIYPRTFVLLGISYEMAPIVNEMLRLHEILQDCVENGYRLPNWKK